jgi:putative membrane protein
MTPDVLAHGIAAAAAGRWTWEPLTAAWLLASTGLYGAGVWRLWRRAGRGRGVRPWQAISFGAGVISLALALMSPLAWVSDVLFSAHMTQHEILMLVSAPLLVFGRPLHVFLWAFAAGEREAIGRAIQRRPIQAGWHAVTAPLPAFVLHAIALWLWHVPVLFDAALAHKGVHAVQHASFVLTAAVFWWGMTHGRYGRLGYGAGVLYVFLTAVHSSVLGALMTVAPSVWYAGYRQSAVEWRVDALADQQLAGLLMWVPSGAVFVVFGLALLAAWLGESERRARLGSVAPR